MLPEIDHRYEWEHLMKKRRFVQVEVTDLGDDQTAEFKH